MEPEESPFWVWCRARNFGAGRLFYLSAMEEAWNAATLAERERCRQAIEDMEAQAKSPESEEVLTRLDRQHAERPEILNALGIAFNQVEMLEQEWCAKIMIEEASGRRLLAASVNGLPERFHKAVAAIMERIAVRIREDKS